MKKYKKTLFITLFLLLLGAVFFTLKEKLFQKNEESLPTQRVLGFPESTGEDKKELKLNSKVTVNWYLVGDEKKIFLYPNSEKLTSKEFFEKEDCSFLSSAGYYKSDFSPTGLLISEYKEVSPFVNSTLSNAVFSVNDFETPRITSMVPRDRLRLALQVGPLLKENGVKQSLKPKNNEEAKRVVLGVTGENKAVFMVFFNPNSVYQGPLLKDLPDLVNEFEKETGIILADAMNLDGGTAAAFLTSETNFPEASFVGSFFCIK